VKGGLFLMRTRVGYARLVLHNRAGGMRLVLVTFSLGDRERYSVSSLL
jgi:hypothetical protein